jgi:hypothetical protein
MHLTSSSVPLELIDLHLVIVIILHDKDDTIATNPSMMVIRPNNLYRSYDWLWCITLAFNSLLQIKNQPTQPQYTTTFDVAPRVQQPVPTQKSILIYSEHCRTILLCTKKSIK